MKKIQSVLTNTLFQIVVLMSIALLFGDLMKKEQILFFYSLSELLKSAIMLVLPFIIFTFVSYALSNIKEGGAKIICMIFSYIVIFNFVTIFSAYFFADTAIKFLGDVKLPDVSNSVIEYAWSFKFSNILSNEQGLIFGVIFGLIASYLNRLQLLSNHHKDIMTRFIQSLFSAVNTFIKYLFIPVVPFFIFGYVLKLVFDNCIFTIIQSNFGVICMIFGIIFVMTFVLLSIACDFKLNRMQNVIKNLMPAVATGFSTMSSAATLPLSIKATYKNTKNEIASNIFIPSASGPYMLSDNIIIPIMSMVLMNLFGADSVGIIDYLIFTFYATIARFAVSGVPGGGAIVIGAVLEHHLNAPPEVVPILITFYMLIESPNTAFNVANCNILAIIFSKHFSAPKEVDKDLRAPTRGDTALMANKDPGVARGN